MSNFIIHIGYPRTATTWFQENLYCNTTNYTFYKSNELRKKILSKTNENLNNFVIKTFDSNTNYIICDEEFINIKINTATINERAKKLYENFKNSKIIIFIRNQIDIIESKYSFYIQSGGTLKLEELTNIMFDNNNIDKWKYYEQISIFKSTFGEENVYVFLYEDFNKNIKSFINNYNSIFGLNNNNKINFSKSNNSINYRLLNILRFLNQFSKVKINLPIKDEKIYFHIPYLFRISTSLIKLLNKLYNKKIHFFKKNVSNKLFNRYVNHFIDSNNKLISSLNLKNIKDYNYPL